METPANGSATERASAGPRVRLAVLGAFAASDDNGAPLTLPTRKTAALLVHLAMRAGTTLRRDALAALLWSGRESEQALASLRKALAAIRRTCGEDVVEGDRATAGARPGAIDVDAHRFEALVRASDPRDLEVAASLWRGPPFSGLDLPDAPWRRWRDGEAARLKAIALDLLTRIAAAQGAPGNAAVAMARQMVEADQAAEAAHRLLMIHYTAEGQRGLAVDQYEACRRALAELGAVPSAETEAARHAVAGENRARASAPTSDKPVVAVLPFADRGGAGDYFGDGIADDVIAALARLPWLTLIARGSSFAFRERPLASRDIAADLGARYVLAGSVQKADGLLRISGEVSDAQSGAVG